MIQLDNVSKAPSREPDIECCLAAHSCPALFQPHGLWLARLLCLWNFPGKNTGMGCCFLLQGIFLTQGSNSRLLLSRRILYHWATWETQRHHQMVNTEIRLIIFFTAKDREALCSQLKQDRELTVAQIMNSLLPNSDLNWRKYRKPLDHSGMT